MAWYEWLITLVPLAFVLWMGIHSRRYARSVADFLVAGRLCGRYVICIGDVANALSIIGLVTYIEVHYKTGFAIQYWNRLLVPLSIVLSLSGYCVYRFRETKSMSLGQFLEMRYSRKFRIFAAGLRSLAEMLTNMIMPALAARFFIYFLDLPTEFSLFGLKIKTFTLIVLIVLTMAISLICLGGTLALVITDAIQGMLCYPLLVIFVLFILYKFSWSNEIAPVMMDRVEGESFLNPFDVHNLRDFNLFMVVVTLWSTIFHRCSWIGAGTSGAAKSPQEQKMAGLLGTWRSGLGSMLYVLIAIAIIAVLNHKDFAIEGKEIRDQISLRLADDVSKDQAISNEIKQTLTAIPPQIHEIGKDAPLGEKNNLDLTYLNKAKDILVSRTAENAINKAKKEHPGNEEAIRQADIDGRGAGNSLFQQFRTLYYQINLAVSMRNILPPVLKGLFCLFMVLAMLSTDDTRIFSAALTITQDCVMPFFKKTVSPEIHIKIIRIVAISVGVFFILGSSFMSQMEYIQLYSNIMCSLWMGGCGPVMIFGLYSTFGTTAGAWTSLLTGLGISLGSVFLSRNWADYVYPFLEKIGAVESVGNFLASVSRPLNPYVVWEMNPTKCPINAYEFYLMNMIICTLLYIGVSYLTCKQPFNLERMLHRGKYALDGERKIKTEWSFRTLLSKLVGITPEYSRGDKWIAWGVFCQSFVYGFIIMFLSTLVWNKISPWPMKWWSTYFFIEYLAVPGIIACFATFWFGIGGFIDLRQLFRDLKARKTTNDLDNGAVEGTMSLADKAALEALDKVDSEKNDKGDSADDSKNK